MDISFYPAAFLGIFSTWKSYQYGMNNISMPPGQIDRILSQSPVLLALFEPTIVSTFLPQPEQVPAPSSLKDNKASARCDVAAVAVMPSQAVDSRSGQAGLVHEESVPRIRLLPKRRLITLLDQNTEPKSPKTDNVYRWPNFPDSTHKHMHPFSSGVKKFLFFDRTALRVAGKNGEKTSREAIDLDTYSMLFDRIDRTIELSTHKGGLQSANRKRLCL